MFKCSHYSSRCSNNRNGHKKCSLKVYSRDYEHKVKYSEHYQPSTDSVYCTSGVLGCKV